MKLILKTSLLAATLLCSVNANASRTIVDFEGITSQGLVDGYGGISGWNEAAAMLNTYSIYQNPQPDMGDAYLAFGFMSGELRFDSAPVIFEGMYYQFVGFDKQVSYDLYYHDQLVYSAPLVPENQPDDIYWLASGYSGLIDKIYFYGTSDGVVIDNLTYSTAAPVPLPGAVWVFASGLLGLLLQNRRHSSRSMN
ncbi:hypothetical protein IVG45_18830 [Methylomonas sp. LL1]|uniref:hypothetical protein n=1 Tax=Methylomonas sp. LL1 TaxID=2785785 RepID=UPI0018C41BD0|nr:hypothetical protein [Methylomonas sp. LL1]QPK62859.1 hypothetical protein IVG45_18830 [Methylomonas sp. LL1]